METRVVEREEVRGEVVEGERVGERVNPLSTTANPPTVTSSLLPVSCCKWCRV